MKILFTILAFAVCSIAMSQGYKKTVVTDTLINDLVKGRKVEFYRSDMVFLHIKKVSGHGIVKVNVYEVTGNRERFFREIPVVDVAQFQVRIDPNDYPPQCRFEFLQKGTLLSVATISQFSRL